MQTRLAGEKDKFDDRMQAIFESIDSIHQGHQEDVQ